MASMSSETNSNTCSTMDFDKYDDELNKILKQFHGALFKIIKISEKLDPKNFYITWLKQQINIFRKIDKENIIKRAKDKFWFYRKEIMGHDISFFHTNQFNKFVKDDENKQFMYSFINMLKKKIDDVPEEEKQVIWGQMEIILETCILYKKLVKDYDN